MTRPGADDVADGAGGPGLVLALNAGSSSLKFALFDHRLAVLARGQVAGLGTGDVRLADDAGAVALPAGATGHAEVLGPLLARIAERVGGRPVVAVGHRVVHGGTRLADPLRLDEAAIAELATLVPLAPLHQPHNIAAIRAAAETLPEAVHYACFDTGFHASIPALRRRFALPAALHEAGVRRYGFHGLSYAHVADRLATIDPALAAGRVVVAHLGAGASLCAMQAGRSVETSMGMTALDGLVMGTRCGALDPGAVLHLLTHLGMDVAAVEALLSHESGLLGVSGRSSDMRVLLAADDAAAREAVALFCWRAAREAGAMMVALGGLDGLVFTGGIGEHAAPVRAAIADALGFAGVVIDPQANARHAELLSPPGAAVTVRIVPADEERVIARAGWAMVGRA